MNRISVIVPCFNEEEALPIYYREMSLVMEWMKDAEMELIFVDDGSSDGTLAEMKKLHEEDSRCHYLSFSRNFGKEAAIYAGLQRATGQYVAIMDVDLQDPPSLLPKMYQILQEEDYDSVATKRSTRTGEPKIRSFLSENFYKFINKISSTQIVNGARDYRLMNRKMVDAVLQMSEYNRFSKGIFGWVGFRTKWIEFENVERSAGETKWSLRKLFAYSLEGITGFSVAPLALPTILGAVSMMISVIMAIGLLVYDLAFGGRVLSWQILTCIMLLLGGLQFLCVGVIGEYLSKTYLEVKKRPVFLLRESSEDEPVKEVHRNMERKMV